MRQRGVVVSRPLVEICQWGTRSFAHAAGLQHSGHQAGMVWCPAGILVSR